MYIMYELKPFFVIPSAAADGIHVCILKFSTWIPHQVRDDSQRPMTLTTHSIIAAALTKPLMRAHPLLILGAAICSHYLADAVPHWDYRLSVLKEDVEKHGLDWSLKTRWKDLAKISFDFFLGAAIVFWLVHPTTTQELWWATLSVIGGTLPDFLQGVNLSFIRHPIEPIQKFHDFCHTKIKLGPYPRIGVPFQLAILGVFLWILVR